jgi:glycosyltransferase involved in cell wall biosynthesis
MGSGTTSEQGVWVNDNVLTAPPSARASDHTGIPAAGPGGVRRRIFHLAKHVGIGNGSAHVVVDLACSQAAAGHDVTVVSGGSTFVELLVDQGVNHVLLKQDQKRPYTAMASLWRLIGLTRAQRPDVLHAHMMGSALLGYIASKACRAPLVTTVHNSFDKHSFIMRLGHHVVAVSDAERETLAGRGYKRDRLSAVLNAPNNSPREQFFGQPQTPAVPRPCILTVCGLHRRKGVGDVIDAFGMVSRAFPDWHLIIVGEGPDRQLLEEQVGRLNLQRRVLFLGFVPTPKPILRQSDIFVLASYADPCSLVIGEARGAGCAIVATAVGGTPQMLEFGKAGRLVPPGAPKRLAAELEALMRSPDARRGLREVAAWGADIFDVRRVAADYLAVYETAIARYRGGATS